MFRYFRGSDFPGNPSVETGDGALWEPDAGALSAPLTVWSPGQIDAGQGLAPSAGQGLTPGQGFARFHVKQSCRSPRRLHQSRQLASCGLNGGGLHSVQGRAERSRFPCRLSVLIPRTGIALVLSHLSRSARIPRDQPSRNQDTVRHAHNRAVRAAELCRPDRTQRLPFTETQESLRAGCALHAHPQDVGIP